MIQNRATAPHYVWGQICDGWRLLDRQDLSVIQERIPPGAGEVRHRHGRARQLFFVLTGQLQIHREGASWDLQPGDALEVPPGQLHRVHNAAATEAVFLVISAPSTRGDREDAPE
jgi:mannose-6-phosphate isomerase-like protein (cupin superfamily)